MLGFNGGLIGARRVPATGAASGLWLPNEQSVAKRAGIWPTTDDPYFANVSLLLHMDGANGSTTFIDNSNNALSVTAVGAAAITTSVPRFGSGAASIPGPGSHLAVPYNAGFTFPGSFDVAMWLNPATSSLANTRGFFELGTYDNGVFLRSSVFSNDTVYVNGTNLGNITPFLVPDEWQYIQVSRNPQNLVEVRISGVLRLTGTVPGTVNSANVGLTIGRTAPGGSPEGFAGYVDELRITKGINRLTEVPAAPFPDG